MVRNLERRLEKLTAAEIVSLDKERASKRRS